MYVQTILRSKGNDVVWVRPGDGITEACNRMQENGIGALLVSDDGVRPLGILSERDIARAVAAYGERLPGMVVRELMTGHVFTCAPDDTIESVMETMTRERIRHVPVMHESRLAGIISIGDVVKFRLDEMAQETEALRGYIAGAG
ncbi:MAG: CBS domain-containing protein [Alphaproteobacteria bacterium]|nr:CBS domain-containing protein [Alphaproteobacteria bacterium]